MLLSSLLPHGFPLEVISSSQLEVQGLALDSREVQEGFLFAALRGTASDGRDFIPSALAKGAKFILTDTLEGGPALPEGATLILSPQPARLLALMADLFWGRPSEKLDLIGVTGTNGKTTTATLLWQLFTHLGYKCGLLSTAGNKIGNMDFNATHTTPDALKVQELMARMVDEDCDFCFMEVSSHSVVQDRIAGLHFKGGIFTNLTHDHLDYHGTFANYRDAKKGFFDRLDLDSFALTNADDRNGKVMLQNTKAAKVTYGLENMADFKAKILEYDMHGMHLWLDEAEVHSVLTGRFNAYNLLAAYGAARMLDVPKDEAVRALSALTPPPGRFTTLASRDGVTGVVDYAHTPDALLNILESIHEINVSGKRVIAIVGCGGNRDRAKRPQMARIAAMHAHQVILTSDNPRDEEPGAILEEMEKGIPASRREAYLVIADRRQAIKTACRIAQRGDIILVAGKGHETYQEIKGVRHPFDDRAILQEHLNERKN